jgi:hypothetical protein
MDPAAEEPAQLHLGELPQMRNANADALVAHCAGSHLRRSYVALQVEPRGALQQSGFTTKANSQWDWRIRPRLV